MPADSPQVHAPGANPDRILLAGDGASAGRGVLTHELGLAGFLARQVSAITRRATDVDIVVSGDMTAEMCSDALHRLRLAQFDCVVLSVGANEALDLYSAETWRTSIEGLISGIEADAPASVEIFVLSIPRMGSSLTFPWPLARIVDTHAERLNRITREICEDHAHITFVGFDPTDAHIYRGSHTYERWAGMLAPWISQVLAPPGALNNRNEPTDEEGRQRALVELGILDSEADLSFDQIAETAQDLFGVSMAAITFIDGDRQWMKSAIGLPAEDAARTDAYCDITIRRAEHFVIEDATLDPRFATNPFTSGPLGVRFYAGYPIESPDGYRIGALCIMDNHPRGFTEKDASLLRTLALQVQRLLESKPPR
ncbi:GAF domain-containing protein [Lacisediminihabitans sp. FW035]